MFAAQPHPFSEVEWLDAISVVAPQVNARGEHNWPFDQALPVDVRLFSYKRIPELQMRHHDYLEILYMFEGSARMQVLDQYFPVRRGDVVLLSSLYHRLERTNARVKVIVLFFKRDAIDSGSGMDESAEYLLPFRIQDLTFPPVISRETGIPEKILELMMQTRSFLPATTVTARLSIRTRVKMALALLVEYYAGQREQRGFLDRHEKAKERLRPLFHFLDSHYSEPVKLGQAALLVGMSKPHFVRFFRQTTGLSFAAYLRRFRISKAQSLLASTDKAISEIGLELGFCDQSHFGVVFRKFAQCSPLQYRRQARR